MLKGIFNKGIPKFITIGIILILVILVGGFTWWQYSEILKKETDLSEAEILEKEKLKDGTVDWETYRNDKYGFEVKYPREWQLAEIENPGTLSSIRPSFAMVFEKPVRDLICNFEIEVVDIEKSSIQDEIDLLKSSNYVESEITLAGFPARELALLNAKSCSSYIIKRGEDDYFRVDKYIMGEFLEKGNIAVYL